MLKGMLISKILGSVIRHGSTAVGGFLIAEGYGDESTVQEVVGAMTVIGGFALSIAEKSLTRL